MHTHPYHDASYAVSVRQNRILQARFLSCMNHSIPACDLLMLRVVNPRIRDLTSLDDSPSGKFATLLFY
ncbi:MAG TPA: hypothetical protein DCF44_05335 [Chitinophagaceae bacterium]|nr:hypothetical protein [Chitinophagaceae bacterium]